MRYMLLIYTTYRPATPGEMAEECRDLDEAVEWAARIPTACGGEQGCVEIRAIHEAGRGIPSMSASGRARV